MLIDIYSDKAN